MSSKGGRSDTANKKIDEIKLKDFMGKVVNDLGATWSTVLVIIGDKLGLYKAMSDSKPITSTELANRTGTTERYVREWLANQAASGYIAYDVKTGKYTLPQEQTMALANENSPVFALLNTSDVLQVHHLISYMKQNNKGVLILLYTLIIV